MEREKDKATLILDAAQGVLTREGFPGTTIAAVAAEAKVSRGLLHYYFRDKEEMLLKVLARSIEEAWETVGNIMIASKTVDEFAENTTRAMRDYTKSHQGAISILAEGLALSRSHPKVKAELTALHSAGRAVFTGEFEKWESSGRIRLELPPRGMATLLMALFDGLAMEFQAISGLAEDESTWVAFQGGLVRLLSSPPREGRET